MQDKNNEKKFQKMWEVFQHNNSNTFEEEKRGKKPFNA